MATTIQSSKKNLAKSSSRSSSKKSSSVSKSQANSSNTSSKPSAEEVMKNIKFVNLQGPGLSAYVVDGLTGKKYKNAEEVMKSYNYVYE